MGMYYRVGLIALVHRDTFTIQNQYEYRKGKHQTDNNFTIIIIIIIMYMNQQDAQNSCD